VSAGAERRRGGITHEEIVCVGHVAADAEKLHQVVELAMNVAAYRYRRRDGNHVALFYEELTGLVAQFADVMLGYRPASAQLRNPPGCALERRTAARRADGLVKVAHGGSLGWVYLTTTRVALKGRANGRSRDRAKQRVKL
jgi:hypothetical protein